MSEGEWESPGKFDVALLCWIVSARRSGWPEVDSAIARWVQGYLSVLLLELISVKYLLEQGPRGLNEASVEKDFAFMNCV